MSLFPLPLTPFEMLMYLDAREEFPMVFYIIFDVRGTVDRARFEQALAIARDRHPLMNALVRWSEKGLEWVPADTIPPALDFCSADVETIPVPDSELNLTDRPGLHLTVVEDGEQSQIILRGHHSCCDGGGVFLFLDDLMAAYHQLASKPGGEVKLFPLDPEVLHLRGSTTVVDPDAPPVGRLQAMWSYLCEVWKFFFYFPAPLKKVEVDGNQGVPFRSRTLAADVVARLRRKAADAEVQLNDLLLREAFLTIQSWNGYRGRWRITMPVSLRDERHAGMPAANVIGYAFLNRSNAECKDPESLLKGIVWETGAIKRYRLAEWFLTGLRIAFPYPRFVRWASRWNSCFATAVLSNVGDPFRRSANDLPRDERGRVVFGNLTLESVRAVPPVRPKTRLTMAVTNYAGRLTITGLGCPQTFGTVGVERFLEEFGRRLEQLAGQVAEREVPATS